MRIGVLWDHQTPAAAYRALLPLLALERQGHEVVWPPTINSEFDIPRLSTCDIVHAYRVVGPGGERALRMLAARGVAICWDNDDDYSAISEDSSFYRTHGAERVARLTEQTVSAARLAQVVTVPSETLAERYRGYGIERVEVIPNSLFGGFRPRRRHDGIVIGWIAGLEHAVDAERLQISATLRRLQEAHPDVLVECIGVDLALPERYSHTALVPFDQLPDRMAGFDIGIAPVADIPFNQARSNIKVKEYAASGLPWLASDLSPYHGLGEEQGGRLIRDHEWFDALEELVRDPDARRRLSKKGRAWAKNETIHGTVGRWQEAFSLAIARKRALV